ncbi:ferredoxin 1b [Callorhinchus milii]|nr:ferredoxin 1b [Callorhinchus milii]AFK11629.1 proferredoxin [Callorhinchus milii]AFM90775.1 proferredoxin [Callorhinchus milii]
MMTLCCARLQMLRGSVFEQTRCFGAFALERVPFDQPAVKVQKRLLSLSSGLRCDAAADSSQLTDKVTVHFINRDGETLTATAKEGDSLLDVVIKHNLDINGFGACEGTLACSTCHLIFDEENYENLDKITDEEMDMLDLAYGLSDTSRLGCQICLNRSMEGLIVKVPKDVADIRKSVGANKQ